MKKNWLTLFISLFIFSCFLFLPLMQDRLPLPSDTIVGLYHPYRDLYASYFPRGIPFKNFLITDPVRQQYPWRILAMESLKKWEWPLWNPYSFSGTPLMGNMQHAGFYPLNLLFFILPSPHAWSMQIVLQMILAFSFMYLYAVNLKLNRFAGILSAISFSLSGFAVAWFEWNTIVHAWLWLPLVLLSIDKITFNYTQNLILEIPYSKFRIKSYLIWFIILLFALISSFFAGHVQTFFYIYLVQFVYFVLRWVQSGRVKKALVLYLILNTLYFILTSFQWLSAFEFINLSARNVDIDWYQPGWFIPWQHTIQFLIPDFFGNPSTLNYWGEWNYGEFVGYIGMFPLMMSLYAIFFRNDRKTLFFGSLFFISLIFSFPTFFAKLPYMLSVPFLSTAQPTRLLSLTCFSLAVLAGLGADHYLKQKKKIFYIILAFGISLGSILLAVSWAGNKGGLAAESMYIAKRNTYFPLLVYILSTLIIILSMFSRTKKRYFLVLLIGLSFFDLFRFFNKFTPFTDPQYLFPSTKTIAYLQQNTGLSRVMSVDNRIFPPNFSIIYKIQSIEGYDPLYLKRYGELIVASERGKPNNNPPFGFKRIITPQKLDSKIIDLLGVKYVLTLNEISDSSLKKVFQEGETRIYENLDAFPRVFFVEKTHYAKNKNETLRLLFDKEINLRNEAIIEIDNYLYNKTMIEKEISRKWTKGKVRVLNYSENKVALETSNLSDGFLVLTDSYYPSWNAEIDGENTLIYRTNYNFRGITVPQGTHVITFYTRLF